MFWAMDPRDQQKTEEEASSRKLRSTVGLILIVLGIAGVLWIAERIIVLGGGPQNIPLIAKFLAFDAAARTIVTPRGNFELPEGLYFGVGSFLFILALVVAAVLAKALISTGAHLMGHEVASSVANRLRDEMDRLKAYLDSRNK